LKTLTIEEYAAESLSQIQLESLSDVKDILGSKEATNDEKIHLIESRFIIEKMETKNLEREIKKLETIESTLNEQMSSSDFRCADCDGSCENDAPDGQLTIFDFLEAATNPGDEPSSEDQSEKASADKLPDEVIVFVPGFPQSTWP
jgi:hypothetical protein